MSGLIPPTVRCISLDTFLGRPRGLLTYVNDCGRAVGSMRAAPHWADGPDRWLPPAPQTAIGAVPIPSTWDPWLGPFLFWETLGVLFLRGICRPSTLRTTGILVLVFRCRCLRHSSAVAQYVARKT